MPKSRIFFSPPTSANAFFVSKSMINVSRIRYNIAESSKKIKEGTQAYPRMLLIERVYSPYTRARLSLSDAICRRIASSLGSTSLLRSEEHTSELQSHVNLV